MQVEFLLVYSVHCISLKDDLIKTETLVWTLHEQALNTAHYLRNSGS